MKKDSRQLLHVGINLVSIPAIKIDKPKAIEFQVALTTQGMDYSSAQPLQDRIVIERKDPTPLQISAISPINAYSGHVTHQKRSMPHSKNEIITG